MSVIVLYQIWQYIKIYNQLKFIKIVSKINYILETIQYYQIINLIKNLIRHMKINNQSKIAMDIFHQAKR